MNLVLLTRLLCMLGIVLHVFALMFASTKGSGWFLLGLLLVSCLPYVLAWAASMSKTRQVLGLGIALPCLVADGFMHYSVFIAPKGSTAALGLIAMPVWNLVLIAPLGAGVAWLIARVLKQRS